MAGGRVRLEVNEREGRGSSDARRLRRNGLVPGVLYGGSGHPRPFVVEERELRRALGGEHGTHAILDVVLAGQQKEHHAVLKDYQLDPRRSTLVHVDLHEVRLDRAIQAQVSVELIGEAEGVKLGGMLSQTVREVTVEALPMAIPDRLELDVSALAIGDGVRIAEIAVPEGATVLEDPELLVAQVLAPRRVEEIEGEAVEEGVEGEETAVDEPAADAGGESEAGTEE